MKITKEITKTKKENGRTIIYYEDVVVDYGDFECPFCGKPMKYKEEKTIEGQSEYGLELSFSCKECGVHFKNNDDYYTEDEKVREKFYRTVNKKLNSIKK